jgi:hypothetical protein
MNAIILSGVGGSTNWLPLILPLVGLVILLKGGEMLFHFIKRKRLQHENRLINGISSPLESTDTPTDNVQ